MGHAVKGKESIKGWCDVAQSLAHDNKVYLLMTDAIYFLSTYSNI